MKKSQVLLSLFICHLSFGSVAAQKTLADYSIIDDCTCETVGFEADVTPLFDKNDLTVFDLPQLAGSEEIVLKARRPYTLKGFSVVSADNASRDLSQLQLFVSADGSEWRSVRTYTLTYPGRSTQWWAQRSLQVLQARPETGYGHRGCTHCRCPALRFPCARR